MPPKAKTSTTRTHLRRDNAKAAKCTVCMCVFACVFACVVEKTHRMLSTTAVKVFSYTHKRFSYETSVNNYGFLQKLTVFKIHIAKVCARNCKLL